MTRPLTYQPTLAADLVSLLCLVAGVAGFAVFLAAVGAAIIIWSAL